jgi:hypothetical protein
MAKKIHTSALTVNPTISAEVGVRNEDLVAVAVARRERALNATLNRTTLESRDLRELNTVREREHQAALEEAGTAHLGAKVKAVEDAFEALGSQLKVVMELTGGRWACDNSTWIPAKATVLITAKSARHASATNPEITREQIPDTDRLRAAADKLEANYKAQRSNMEAIQALKEAIRNISSTERQARAALAEATLRGTESGRELLEAMTGMSGLMSLPAIGMVLDSEVE